MDILFDSHIYGVIYYAILSYSKVSKVLTDVYYIPKLQSNIVSLGQLEEARCKVVLENGWLQIFDRVDQGRRLIVSTPALVTGCTSCRSKQHH